LLHQDGIELTFDEAALRCIAQNTLKNKTGARGLHAELERVLLPHMFNGVAYRESGLTTLTITADMVNIPTELKVDNAQTSRKVSNGTR
jgi:ATP-dependent Clp protease ATP-binding subunit ClpX